MKHVKRLLATLLCAMMVLSIVACAGDPPAPQATPDSPTPEPAPASSDPDPVAPPDTDPVAPPDGPVTIKVMQWALDNQTTDFENLWYFQQLEAETGVSVEWNVVKESDWQTQMNLMFTSLDMPDVIIRPDASLDIEEYGVTQGLLMPLDEYIPQYMPNYNSRLGMNNVMDILPASDGQMYYIGYLNAQKINHDAHFFINQTWLNEVGKNIPTTVDELTDVLKAFKDAKGVAPMSGGGGIEHHVEGIYTYFGMFGVPLTRYIYATIQDNGQIVFPGYMDGFREAVEWLAMCYKEGLLDPDALTQDENAWNEKVNSDQVGFQTYLRLINSAWTNPDTIQNWVSILPPAGSKGATLPKFLEIPAYGAVLTVTNENIEASLRWLDAQFETERMLTAVNGPAELDDDLRAILGEDLTGEPLLVETNGVWSAPNVPANNALYKIVPVAQGQYFAPGDYIFDIFDMPPHRVERMNYATEYEAAGVMQTHSYDILHKLLKLSSDDSAETQRLFADIDNLMKTSIANFIIGGVTDASWDAFLSEAENVGVAKYISIYQSYYDAYK